MGRTHDIRDYQVSIDGTIAVGYGQNGGFRVEWDGMSWEAVVGAGGEETRARQNNSGGTLTITLAQTSPYNDVLSGLLLADEVSGDAKGPLAIRNTRGRTVIACREAYVMGPPNLSINRGAEDNEWRVRLVPPVRRFIGGST